MRAIDDSVTFFYHSCNLAGQVQKIFNGPSCAIFELLSKKLVGDSSITAGLYEGSCQNVTQKVTDIKKAPTW